MSDASGVRRHTTGSAAAIAGRWHDMSNTSKRRLVSEKTKISITNKQ